MLRACPREKEVRDLVVRGQWPQASAPELRNHVSACRACSDLALVAGAFQRARAESVAAIKPDAIKLAGAGALWWRAQLRRRSAAVERVSRPLATAQIFALALNLLVVAGFVGLEARHGIAWLDWLEGLLQSAATQLAGLSSSGLFDSGWFWLLFASAAAALALLAGAVVYLASEKQ
ncbi:MAG: hypothetical protein WBX18_23475 [Terracidiphilus sp.]